MRENDEMAPQHQRDPLFDTLRTEMASLDTPHSVEQDLMQAFARQFPPRRWYQRLYQALSARTWALGGGLAGALVLALVLALVPALHTPRPALPAADSRPAAMRDDDGALFIALDSIERIEDEPAPRVVETEVPRSSLAALGVPLTPDNAGDAVKAELLVAADGQALALRLSDLPDTRRFTN